VTVPPAPVDAQRTPAAALDPPRLPASAAPVPIVSVEENAAPTATATAVTVQNKTSLARGIATVSRLRPAADPAFWQVPTLRDTASIASAPSVPALPAAAPAQLSAAASTALPAEPAAAVKTAMAPAAQPAASPEAAPAATLPPPPATRSAASLPPVAVSQPAIIVAGGSAAVPQPMAATVPTSPASSAAAAMPDQPGSTPSNGTAPPSSDHLATARPATSGRVVTDDTQQPIESAATSHAQLPPAAAAPPAGMPPPISPVSIPAAKASQRASVTTPTAGIAPADAADEAATSQAVAAPSITHPVVEPAPSTTPIMVGKAAAATRDAWPVSSLAADSASPAAPAPQSPSAAPVLPANPPDAALQSWLPDKDTRTAAITDATTILGTGAPAPSDAATTATQTPPAATPATTPAPPPPAAQLAHAAASLQVGADGTSHVTIRLDPAELGHLQIRISRATDGTTSVDVAVERPETLASLQNDLGHLHQALDRAGLPDQRNVTMHLAGQTDQPGGTSLGSNTASGNGFTPQGGFQQGARQQHQAANPPMPATIPDSLPAPLPQRAAAAAGSGVNITA
jgi:flagellar hook-length control protein FliK